jgi:hypothetical protein
MSDERVPAQVFPLAQYLAEEMDERGWTAGDVGIRMGGKTLEEHGKNILVVDLLLAVTNDDRLVISPELYRELEAAFGVSEGFFERLDEGWRKYPERRVTFETPEHLFSRTAP